MSRDDDEPVDVAALRADDELIEDLRAGAQPPTGDHIARLLAALRDQAADPDSR